MLRFLLLLTSVLLLLAPTAEAHPSVAQAHSSAAAVVMLSAVEASPEVEDDCHCCHDESAADSDCCSRDFGACCAPGMAAALTSGGVKAGDPVAALPQEAVLLPLHLLRPRDNGPPPTPPPIGESPAL